MYPIAGSTPDLRFFAARRPRTVPPIEIPAPRGAMSSGMKLSNTSPLSFTYATGISRADGYGSRDLGCAREHPLTVPLSSL
jgi:hypothetical protein